MVQRSGPHAEEPSAWPFRLRMIERRKSGASQIRIGGFSFQTTMSRYREWDLSCKLYVGNLGSSASKHEIESAFTKYGPLRNVWVARNPPGFAFVEFEDPRDAEDAVRGLDGTRLCGTRVRVEMSSGRSRRGGGGGGGRRNSGPTR
uniref:RRM domain-containing protein n=1 Tax=Timema genevievae TaxID=629358 RepID=A0A7R9JRG7_TIMGE|nr:unnamed protein product [Timema genevievae]